MVGFFSLWVSDPKSHSIMALVSFISARHNHPLFISIDKVLAHTNLVPRPAFKLVLSTPRPQV